MHSMQQYLTNPFFGPQEGFGEQYKMIMYYAVFAELYGLSFVYTPFKQVAHNYSNDPQFLSKLEQLINLQSVFELVQPEHGLKNIFVANVIHTLHQRMHDFESSQTLGKIRKAFYEMHTNPFDQTTNIKTVHVAIHVRRKNTEDHYSHSGLAVPDEVYLEIMNKLRHKYTDTQIQFHLFSQGLEKDFESFSQYFGKQVELCLNHSLEETFIQMVFADILVVSPSALSYSAGLLSRKQVYYIQHCNPPLPSWSKIEGYISPRLYHKFSYQTTVYFDSEKGEYIIRKDGFPFGPLRIV